MQISIIIPIYNAEKYLKRCLDSILSQTFADIEIILINDGSSDNSRVICENYLKKEKRIILLNQVNKGPAVARNEGIKIAKGDYIGFVDADDFIERNMYQSLINIILKENVDVVISNFKVFNGKTYIIPKTKIPLNAVLYKDEIKRFILKSYYSGCDSIVPSLCNKIYKRVFLQKHKLLIDESRVRAEDYWFNFEVFKKAESVYAKKGAFYHYYNNKNSVMKTFRENQFELFLETQKKLSTENLEFGFKINSQKFNLPFIINTNEYILMAIRQKGYLGAYKFIKKIISNEEFNLAFKQVIIVRWHIKIIKFLINIKVWVFSYLIYCIWSTKIEDSSLK